MRNEAAGNKLTIDWTDGLHQEFDKQPDGTWTLSLTDPNAPPGPLPKVTGYDLENIQRVVRRAITGRKEA